MMKLFHNYDGRILIKLGSVVDLLEGKLALKPYS
jgi:hypothetical protein